MLEFADSHAHIYDKAFDEDRDEVIKDFGKNGVKFVVVPGSDLESSRLAVNLSQNMIGFMQPLDLTQMI